MTEHERPQTGSTRKRWLLWGGLTLSLLLIAGGLLVWLAMPSPGPMERAYNSIRKGMTLKEVQGLFGGPPDLDGLFDNGNMGGMWSGDDGLVVVTFDSRTDVVIEANFIPGEAPSPSRLQRVWDRLRSWLGWRHDEESSPGVPRPSLSKTLREK
jgi:LPXTG-motif cell wall-anchored protein